MGNFFSKDKWNYAFYTVSHPVDAYYEIRHRNRGSVSIAVFLVMIFSLCFSINRMMASFVVNDADPRSVDSFTELGGVLLLYFLFCIGNWSITCLMGGEGRLKDIAIAIGYAALPLILSFIPATIMSWFVAADEETFYFLILFIGIAWAVIMALIGIMQVHNYTLGKTLITLGLTFVAVLIIIFIGLLITDLINQVYGFFYSIYTELIFRT